jgi:hypothetical protein
MKREQALPHLEIALAVCPNGKWSFCNEKALIRIKMVGRERPFVFRKRDKVAFRIENQGLIVENLKHPRSSRSLAWEKIEGILAGEPEAENKRLFQG